MKFSRTASRNLLQQPLAYIQEIFPCVNRFKTSEK